MNILGVGSANELHSSEEETGWLAGWLAGRPFSFFNKYFAMFAQINTESADR